MNREGCLGNSSKVRRMGCSSFGHNLYFFIFLSFLFFTGLASLTVIDWQAGLPA